MTGSTQATIAVATPNFAKRRARALVGWMTEEEGVLWIAGRQIAAVPDPDHLEICRQARAVVAARQQGLDQTNLVTPLPAELDVHIAALRAHPLGAKVLEEAGEPALVDLRRVCATQPFVHTEDALKRVEGLTTGDWASIAALTLPIPAPDPVPLQAIFDPVKQAHVIASPSPNLRVIAVIHNAQIQSGDGLRLTAFGFGVALVPSYVSVASLRGRYFLRDGYHRAYGLLSRGITHVPALVREFPNIESVKLQPGNLPQDAFLGERPPLLPDYLLNVVGVDTTAPMTTKMVVVQALEITPLG